MTEEADSGWAPQEAASSGADPTKMAKSNGRVLHYIWIALSFVARYTVRKVLECLGLNLTDQQRNFWNAVQLKKVIADFKSLIKYCDERGIEIQPIPASLDDALRKADDAVHADFVEICAANYISVEQQSRSDAQSSIPPYVLRRSTGIPPASKRKRFTLTDDGGAVDVAGEGFDEPDTPSFIQTMVKHASTVKVKPIGKVHTGRLRAEIEEEEEGYGGFFNALCYLLKSPERSSTEARKVDVMQDFHSGKKSFNISSDRTPSPAVGQAVAKSLTTDSTDYVDKLQSDSDDDDDNLTFFGGETHRVKRKQGTVIVKGQTRSAIDGSEEETDGPTAVKTGQRKGLIGDFDISWLWKCCHKKAREGYRPDKNLIQEIYDFIPLRVTNFKYKEFRMSDLYKVRELQKRASRWPVFSYWLMAVHVLILIVTLSVYGFAPFGYGQFTERSLVQLSDLSVQVVEKNVTANVFLGPPQDALVLLGANYAPCMRRDRLLFKELNNDMYREAAESGCCIRNDRSGCYQVPSQERCPVAARLARFVFTDPTIANRSSMSDEYSNRAVCGTSPTICTNPSPMQDPRWRLPNITQWPICTQSESAGSLPDHLTCNLTGRPCCVGIQALCLITTREHCTFLGGRFHQNASLCSQIDCLDEICGLIRFSNMNVPDQVYRLWLSLFLHGGILHLIVILIMTFYIVRDLEKYLGWLTTVILFLGTGIGGNIASVLFVPYNPQVGPSAGIFGAISFFLVYIIFHWNYFKWPIFEILKYLFLVVIPLFFIGLFPYVDNYARLFGFIFGIFFSFIFVHYIEPNKVVKEFRRYKFLTLHPDKTYRDIDPLLFVKLGLIVVGLLVIVGLYVFCFVWFYEYQTTWPGFTYFNCIPFSPTLCLDYRQQVRSRDTFV